MAIPFLNNIDLSDNQLLNAKLHITSTAPTAAAGQIYFDSTANPGGDPPTYDLTAKYYSNATDNWVSLKEYSFPTGTYVTGALTGTTPKPVITFDLNAVDGAAAETVAGNGIRYLSKNNKWANIDDIPGTYDFTISDNASPAVSEVVDASDIVTIAATADLTSNLTISPATTKVITLGLKVGPQVSGPADNYIMNQGTALAASSSTLPFNYLTAGNPPDGLSTVKKTTFGTIPVEALTLVKNYIDSSVAGGLIYQGGFDGSTGFVTGTSDYLDNRTGSNQIAVNKGWTYTVTTAGTFYGEVVEVGDVLIAEDNLSSGTGSLSDWTTVQNNIDLASLTQVGIGNVNAPLITDLDTLGISVAYAAGTATVGLNIIGLPAYSGSASAPDSASLFIPLHNADTSDSNEVIAIEQLATIISGNLSKSGTITAGNLSGTVIHDFGINTIVQTINSSGDTVFCDVTRTATTSVATIAVAEVTDITILVQKIG